VIVWGSKPGKRLKKLVVANNTVKAAHFKRIFAANQKLLAGVMK